MSVYVDTIDPRVRRTICGKNLQSFWKTAAAAYDLIVYRYFNKSLTLNGLRGRCYIWSMTRQQQESCLLKSNVTLLPDRFTYKNYSGFSNLDCDLVVNDSKSAKVMLVIL